MKSKKSSCKAAAFRKDLSRFTPLWIAYLLCLFLGVFLVTSRDREYWFARDVVSIIQAMPVINCGYALIVAQLLFGDLYNSRMCNALHALPLKRGQWFGIHIWTGFLFSLIPTTITACAMTPALLQSIVEEAWKISIAWWVGVNLQYVFFFGLAVFSVMCVGNRFAMAVVYGMLNFASVIAYFLVVTTYTPLLHGVVTNSDPFVLLCPVAQMIDSPYVNIERLRIYPDATDLALRNQYRGTFALDEGWGYLLVLTGLGIVLLLLAKAMYKKRRLECAGDFSALRAMEPLLQLAITLLGAAGLQMLVTVFLGSAEETGYVVLFVGLAAAWFAGRMLISRTTRVWGLRSWLGLALVAVLMGGSLYATWLDPLGIVRWVPEEAEVKSVRLYSGWRADVVLDTRSEIEEALTFHRLCAAEQLTGEDINVITQTAEPRLTQKGSHVTMTYTLNNGRTVQREYYFWVDSEQGRIAEKYMSSLEAILSEYSDIKTPEEFLALADSVTELDIDNLILSGDELTREDVTSFFQAVIADCEAGAMAQDTNFHEKMVFEDENLEHWTCWVGVDVNGDNTLSFGIYGECENTLAWLEEQGHLETLRQRLYAYYG